MHLKTNLIPEISDEDLEEMLETLRPIYPVVKNQYDIELADLGPSRGGANYIKSNEIINRGDT